MKNRQLNLRDKSIFISMILLMFFVMLIPVYQASQMRAIEYKIAQANAYIVDLDEKEKILEASANNFTNINIDDLMPLNFNQKNSHI